MSFDAVTHETDVSKLLMDIASVLIQANVVHDIKIDQRMKVIRCVVPVQVLNKQREEYVMYGISVYAGFRPGVQLINVYPMSSCSSTEDVTRNKLAIVHIVRSICK